MKCPKCQQSLDASNEEFYKFNTCSKCSGIWLSGAEIRKIINSEPNIHSFDGTPVFLSGTKEPLKEHNCPVCVNTMLCVKSYKGVKLDICDNCNGIFFDKNELNELFPNGFRNADVADNIKFGGVELTIEYFISLFR